MTPSVTVHAKLFTMSELLVSLAIDGVVSLIWGRPFPAVNLS